MNQNQKFALGGGGYVLYAPDFPAHQTSPGFTDAVHLYNTEVVPLYHLSFLANGVPLHLECKSVAFENGSAILTYTDGKALTVVEERFVTTDDRCVSNIKMESSSKEEQEISIVQWTFTDVAGEAPALDGDSFRVRRSLESPDGTPIPVEIVWSSPSSKGAKCLQGFHAVGGSNRPDYEETPWFDMGPELPTPRAKRAMAKPSPINPAARCYLGLFRTMPMKSGAKVEHRFEANVVFKGSGINYRPRRPDPKDENNYLSFMAKAPKFQSESKELERIVKHRLEMLHLLRLPNGVGSMSSPAICSGLGRFHQVTAKDAPALVREARWLQDPTYARGVLKVFFENIRQSGLVPAWIGLSKLTNTDFYHADWGGAFEALDSMHPDRATKRAVLMGMQRYVRWLANNRDPEGSGLTDIVNYVESGQTDTRRFTVVGDKGDAVDAEPDEEFRLKGVDVSVYRYRMVRFLHKVADEMQEKSMANRFAAEAADIQEIISKRMWDDRAGLYIDLDPKTRRRTGVKAAVGFLPMVTDIPKPAQIEKMLATLSDRKEFWTKFPVPTVAISDPYFNENSQWKGTRVDNPANGRVSMAMNCQIMEALSHRAERGDKKARRLLGDLFRRSMKMLSGELENSEIANGFEHYHPITGRASRFHGSEFAGAAVLDSIFRVGCGFAVRFNEIQIDPVIDDMPDFKLQGVPVGNKKFNVERKGKRVKVLPG